MDNNNVLVDGLHPDLPVPVPIDVPANNDIIPNNNNNNIVDAMSYFHAETPSSKKMRLNNGSPYPAAR